MCLVRGITFYEKLVIVTLSPIIVLGALWFSYASAMRWYRGTDRDDVENRRQAKVRHASIALLVRFLVRCFSGGLGETRFGFVSVEKVIDKPALDVALEA